MARRSGVMQNTQLRRIAWTWLLAAAALIGTQAFAQTAPPAPVIDLTGEWAARVHEDAIYRGAGGFLGDYEGLPINAAARQMAESWDADVLSQPERNTQAHPAVYAMRGEGPNIRISEIRDPATEQLIGLRIVGMFGRADRTVWLDGRASSIRIRGAYVGWLLHRHLPRRRADGHHDPHEDGRAPEGRRVRQSLQRHDRTLLPAWAVSDDGHYC